MVTVITKTIGPTGRDYATFALAEADTSNIGTSADLVANDEAIVFEADDTTFTSGSTLNIANTALTLDATRNVSYTAASGRPVYEYTGTGRGVSFFDPYTRWSGIDVLASSGSAATQVRANSGYGAAQAGTVIENAALTAATSAVSCEKFATGHALGTSSEPITLRNLVSRSIVAVSQFISGTGHTTGAHCLVVNCTHLGGSSPNQAWNWAVAGGMPSASFKIINCANLAQNTSNDANITGGGVDISGSTNNIGNAAGSNSSFHFANIGGGIGAQYTPTTSFSTPLGAGDYSVFMGSNGSLANVTGNDVWQQGVGPGTNASVPTTDINGVARSGASCNPGAFEADGFVAPTVTTQTIGPVGRDYATFTLAEASLPAEDITFTNRAFVFEADAAVYNESAQVNFISSLTTDPTRNVTYKHAAGSEHGGSESAGVRIVSTAYTAVNVRDDNTAFVGLVIANASSLYAHNVVGFGSMNIQGQRLTNCIIACSDSNSGYGVQCYRNSGNGFLGTASNPVTVSSCVFLRVGIHAVPLGSPGSGATIADNLVFSNCTFLSKSAAAGGGTQAFGVFDTSGTLNIKVVNCLNVGVANDFNQSTSTLTVTTTGSAGNFGVQSSASWQFPGKGSPYPITASTAYDPGSGDFALYVGKNGALLDSPHNDVIDGGVGPAANADVPTTDILGDTRSGTTTNPGAFALAQATAVLTRTIGPVGRDYATFTEAEADVENIGGSADLVFENERIEFLADAGTYDERLVVSSTLTTDATRNVTYKPASGSEHGGASDAGVILYRNAAGQDGTRLQDDYTELRGLNLYQGFATVNRSPLFVFADGCVIDGCILTSLGAGSSIGVQLHGASAAASLKLQNSVLDVTYIGLLAYSGNAHSVTALNVTTSAAITSRAFAFNDTQSGEFVNCLVLGSQAITTAGTVTLSGSNNFGPSGNPFPAAIQGSPYPITPTTNTTPGFGDYAIYNASTGALVVVDDNAALGGGVGPAANADVPVFDINGVKRIGGGCDPGAFEGNRARSTDVWDVMYGSHNIPGTFGKLVQDIPGAVPSAEEIATAVWNKLIADHQGAGSFGELSQQTKLAADRAGTQRLQ